MRYAVKYQTVPGDLALNDINATLPEVVKALEADDKERRGKTINQQMESGEYFIRDFEGDMTARRILILLDAIGVKFGDNCEHGK